MNCFPNETCQVFVTFPVIYQIEVTPGGRLYFPGQLFPNVTQSCTSNITYLLTKLEMANISSISVLSPRDAVIDNHGYLVTIEVNTNYLDRFNPTTLNRINHISIPYSLQTAVTYFNGAYYIAPYYG
jgi:hypothetical protein